ncbi:MAG: hypothetical protein KDE27_18475 [Planctomycetes bacterium]|nr:hypothetical protein [Planctomycetota bacterium]
MQPTESLFRAVAFLAPLTLIALRAEAQAQTWVRVGGDNYTSFAVSPDYAQDGRVWAAYTVFPTTSQTHVELSVDHGDSFAVQSQIANSVHIREIVASPTFATDRTLYQSQFRTGMVTDELMRSTDAGATWNSANLPNAGILGTIRLSPDYATDGTLFANRLTYDRAYRSTDGGQSWSVPTHGSLPLGGSPDVAFAVDFPVSNVVHMWHKTYKTITRSTDGGATFSTPPTTCTAMVPYDVEVAPIGPGAQRIVFAAGLGGTPSSPAPALFRSTDDGLHYAAVTTGLPAGSAVYRVQTPPDFASSGRVYVGTDDGVYYSDDHGGTYAPLPAVGLAGMSVVDLQLAGGSRGDLYARVASSPVDTGQLYRLRLSGTGVVDLGSALAGANGDPELWAATPFGAVPAFDLRLDRAAGNTTGLHALGLVRANLPFAGGTLVPDPLFVLLVSTDPSGSAVTSLQWPANAVAGNTIYLQTWLIDGAGVAGLASSNGLQLRRL